MVQVNEQTEAERLEKRVLDLEQALECALEVIDRIQKWAQVPRGAMFTEAGGRSEVHQHAILWAPSLSRVPVDGGSRADRPLFGFQPDEPGVWGTGRGAPVPGGGEGMRNWLQRRARRKTAAQAKGFFGEWSGIVVRVKQGPWAGLEATVQGTDSDNHRLELVWPLNNDKNQAIRMWFLIADVEEVKA